MNFNHDDFLKRLKKQKQLKKLRIEEISQESGIPVGTVSKILAGITTDPKINTMISIANTLGVSIDYLVYGKIFIDNYSCEEKDIIKKYRLLDEGGKGRIKNQLEYEVTQQAQVAESKEEHLA